MPGDNVRVRPGERWFQEFLNYPVAMSNSNLHDLPRTLSGKKASILSIQRCLRLFTNLFLPTSSTVRWLILPEAGLSCGRAGRMPAWQDDSQQLEGQCWYIVPFKCASVFGWKGWVSTDCFSHPMCLTWLRLWWRKGGTLNKNNVFMLVSAIAAFGRMVEQQI